MDDKDFHQALLTPEEKNDEWTAAAEQQIRLHKKDNPDQQDPVEKTAFEIQPEDRPDIPKKDFAQPGKEEAGHKGKYPIPDRQHARTALGFSAMHGSEQDKAAVRRKVLQKYPDMDVEGDKDKEEKDSCLKMAASRLGILDKIRG
jgi:hypothetical protein